VTTSKAQIDGAVYTKVPKPFLVIDFLHGVLLFFVL
jgi:hypothetical protein